MTENERLVIRNKLICGAVIETILLGVFAGVGLWVAALCIGVGLASSVYALTVWARTSRAVGDDDA